MKLEHMNITIFYLLGLAIIFFTSTANTMSECPGYGWANMVGLFIIGASITVYQIKRDDSQEI